MIPLLVIRHAPTAWNDDGRIQGRTDIELSEPGRSVAARWRLPPGWQGAQCLCSPLRRAFQTALLLGLDPLPDRALIEMEWAEWEGRRLPELRAELGEVMVANEARGLDLRPPGGESPREVQQRLRAWLAGLTEPTIAVTHKGVIRALYALATGWEMTDRPPHKLKPLHAHAFTVADGEIAVARLNIPLEPTA
jgi:broad specificity phosphatase PhoE